MVVDFFFSLSRELEAKERCERNCCGVRWSLVAFMRGVLASAVTSSEFAAVKEPFSATGIDSVDAFVAFVAFLSWRNWRRAPLIRIESAAISAISFSSSEGR